MKLYAVLAGRQKMTAVLSGERKMSAVLNAVNILATAVKYTGSYEVTPNVDAQMVLQTKDKLLKENVTVKKVPQFAVSNESGGYTYIIGEDAE